jgi:hypothetical protein
LTYGYTVSNNIVLGYYRSVIGIMIATLCWKNNEWVGLSMACAFPEILQTMEGLPVSIYPADFNVDSEGKILNGPRESEREGGKREIIPLACLVHVVSEIPILSS